MKKKKVGFLGLFGQQNWGNECTLQAMIYNARRHLTDFDFYCVCSDPADTSKRYGIPAFPMQPEIRKHNIAWGQHHPIIKLLRKIFVRIPIEIRHWVTVYKTLKGTQMLIAPGTGLLTDFERRVFGRCYEIFKWSIISKLCQCKLLFVSVGAGPIRHPMSRLFVKWALSLADYRSYRNENTKNYLKSIRFKADSDPIYPDLGFSLQRTMITECGGDDREKNIIGVGVADRIITNKVSNGKDSMQQNRELIYRGYIQKTSSFVRWLLENRYTVRMLIGDSLFDSSVKEDIRIHLKKMGCNIENGNIIDEPITSLEQLLFQLESTSAVISSRFHNIILAIMLNKPVISVSYHEKFDSLMNELELEEYCQDASEINFDTLKEQFTRLMANDDCIKQKIKEKTEKYRSSLDNQYEFIFHSIMVS